MLLFSLLWLASAHAEEIPPFILSHRFAVKVCKSGGECEGPNITGPGEQKVELKPFSKAHVEGWDGWDRSFTAADGVLIKSEVHVIRYKRQDHYKYYVYAMIRTGKRNGKTKTVTLRHLEDFKEFVIKDTPLKTKNGTVEAQLLIGPPEVLTYESK